MCMLLAEDDISAESGIPEPQAINYRRPEDKEYAFRELVRLVMVVLVGL